MNTDEARQISEEIHRRMNSLGGGESRRRNSAGDLPLTGPQSHWSPFAEGEGSQAIEGDRTVRRVLPRGNLPLEREGTVGGETLLTIPSVSTVGGGEAENQTLARPPMKNPTMDIERRRGTRPKRGPTYTTQTIQEEARAAQTEDEARQLRGTNFFLPIVGQPRISQLRSWRGPVLTDQGNPGVYVQIEEWLGVYQTNLFVVDEITGRMYACRGENLEVIPELASHRPLEDHELSVSKNVPEKEDGRPHPASTKGDMTKGGPGGLGGGQQLVPGEVGEVGEVGRTPIPVAESTRQPVMGVQSPWPTREPMTKPPDSPRVSMEEKRPTIILSKRDATNPPVPPHTEGEKGGPPRPLEPGEAQLPPRTPVISSDPEERGQIIATARQRKSRAVWSRNCILNLRQDRDGMEQNFIHVYEVKAQDENVSRAVLREVRDVFVQRYTDIMYKISQAVQEFYLNQEIDYERELDFPADDPVDLTNYPEGYEWTEGEYLRLRFAALHHESSWDHVNEAYTYMRRTRPSDMADMYDRYQQARGAWDTQMRGLQRVLQAAEGKLEERGRRDQWAQPSAQGPQSHPPRNAPMGGAPIDYERVEEEWRAHNKKQRFQKGSPRHSSAPSEGSQEEARKAALAAAREINQNAKAQGNQFGGEAKQSPQVPFKSPPKPQRELKIYDETPTGRPLPTLREIRQANLRKVLEEEGVDTPCDICGGQDHDYRRCPKGAYLESQNLQTSNSPKGRDGDQCPNCDIPYPGVCPCGWCTEKGHISQDCLAKHWSQSMKDHFRQEPSPRRPKIQTYECRKCRERHPFNKYCPYAARGEITPGSARPVEL